jgi:hypothetical protein
VIQCYTPGTVLCALTGGCPISITPEVTENPKPKPKRSAKPRRDHTANLENSTLEPARAPDPPPANPEPAQTPAVAPPVYEWDRTVGEKAEQARQRILKATPFPTPPARTVPGPKFFEYWNNIITLEVGRFARLYVQRWHPVLLPEEQQLHGMRKDAYPSEKRYESTDGEVSEQRILEDIGCGDYTVKLIDTRLPFQQGGVLFCEKFATIRDYEKHPPIFDLDRLDWTDPANGQYIKWGRSKGILRDPETVAEEKAEMAAATVTTELLQNAKEERARADGLLQAELDRTRKELETKTRELEEKKHATPVAPVTAATPAGDLMNVVQSVATLAQTLAPRPDSSFKDFLDLEKEREITRRQREQDERTRANQEADAARQRADNLQAQMLEEARKHSAGNGAAPATAAVAPKSEVEILKEAIEKRDLITQLAGGAPRRRTAESDDEPQESSADKWAAILTPLAPIIGQTVQGVFQLAFHGLNTWSEIKYNEAVKSQGGEPKLPSHVKKENVTAGEPLKPQPAANPAEDTKRRQFNTIMEQVIRLVKPMKRALENGDSGAQFADGIINSPFTDGRIDYDKIRSIGVMLQSIGMQVDGADLELFRNAAATCLSQLKGVWEEFSSIPTFGQFLADFYNYDEIKAAEQKEED